jgi:hypothetical protein
MASNQPISTSYKPVRTKRSTTKRGGPYNKNNINNTQGKSKKISPIFIKKTRRVSHYIDPINGKQKRIVFKGKIKPDKYPKLYNYFNKKIFKNEALSDAPDGIYTWIQTKKNTETEYDDIYATQIESNQEIGTLHMNLIYLIEKINPSLIVDISGELEIKTDPESRNKIISYNFKSGYFFKTILTMLRKKNPNKTNQQIQEELSSDFLKNLQSNCPNCEIIPKLDEDFIENTKFISNKKVINLYRNLYNNDIQEEENIGNERGLNDNGNPIIVKYNYKVNLTNNTQPYSRNEYKPLEGGKCTYKNKRRVNRTYKKYKHRK